MTALRALAPSLLLLACECGGQAAPTAEVAPTADEPAALAPTADGPATIMVTYGLEGGRFVTATLERLPSPAIVGCVSTVAGTCFATVRAPLDADAQTELGAAVADVLAIPLCEPEMIVAGDVDYALSWPGAPRAYVGHVPADLSHTAARQSGPCRADARLAWWIARWILGASRAAAEQPEPIHAVVDVSSATGPRFVNVSVSLATDPPAVEGCASSLADSCYRTQRVTLDPVQSARLRALVEDVRAEPCHVPFPAGLPLSFEMGLAYDGRCGADAALSWWMARTLVPDAMDGSGERP